MNIWKILGVVVVTQVVVNGIVTTVYRIQNDRLHNQSLQEEILKRKEARAARKASKRAKKNGGEVDANKEA